MIEFIRPHIRHERFFAAMMIFCTGLLLALPATAQLNVSPSMLTEEHEATVAVEWMDLLYRLVESETLSAPAASRAYGYAGVSLYEAVVNGMPNNYSLAGQLPDMPNMPFPAEDAIYDWPSVANSTLAVVIEDLFVDPTDETLEAIAEKRAELAEIRAAEIEETVADNSIAYGEELGKALLDWIARDGYAEIDNNAYELPAGDESYYLLTSPNTAPNEPYWGTLRTFGMFYPEQCNIPLDIAYSSEPGSTFYAQALEVKNAGDNLTEEQREIARFWVDTPGITGAPAGHWVSIQNQMVELLDLNLQQAAGMYVQVGMALADSFISAWALKYEVMLLRPVTYIQEHISRNWQPYIESPPFPEYPSGHSVVSGAAAEVLTHLFGQVAFTDRTHIMYRHEPLQRSFTSFEAAGYEAAISRMYGGIHYRAAIENGMRQGRCVGQSVINNIRLGPIPQGAD